jgi:hypothetical protein
MSEENKKNNPYIFQNNSMCYPHYVHFNHCHHFSCISIPNFENFAHLYPPSSTKLW